MYVEKLSKSLSMHMKNELYFYISLEHEMRIIFRNVILPIDKSNTLGSKAITQRIQLYLFTF